MYRHCIFCAKSLGTNEVIEGFPVGRRLAFDASKGRLWVVCGQCSRWNLTPLEERWEAIEACEARFRSTPKRASTEHIGWCVLREGLELIRIGRPLRPEFAGWRYGRQLRHRRAKWAVRGAGAAAVIGSGIILPPVLPVATAAALLYGLSRLGYRQPPADLRVISNMGQAIDISTFYLGHPRLRDGGGKPGAWQLEIDIDAFLDSTAYLNRRFARAEIARAEMHDGGEAVPAASSFRPTAVLTGPEAVQALAQLTSRMNSFGASSPAIRDAVSDIERTGDPASYFAEARRRGASLGLTECHVARLPRGVRLALEIASNEDSERRVLEGDLDLLERMWREAEEIGSTADSLAIPASIEQAWQRLRDGQVHQSGRG